MSRRGGQGIRPQRDVTAGQEYFERTEKTSFWSQFLTPRRHISLAIPPATRLFQNATPAAAEPHLFQSSRLTRRVPRQMRMQYYGTSQEAQNESASQPHFASSLISSLCWSADGDAAAIWGAGAGARSPSPTWEENHGRLARVFRECVNVPSRERLVVGRGTRECRAGPRRVQGYAHHGQGLENGYGNTGATSCCINNGAPRSASFLAPLI